MKIFRDQAQLDSGQKSMISVDFPKSVDIKVRINWSKLSRIIKVTLKKLLTLSNLDLNLPFLRDF